MCDERLCYSDLTHSVGGASRKRKFRVVGSVEARGADNSGAHARIPPSKSHSTLSSLSLSFLSFTLVFLLLYATLVEPSLTLTLARRCLLWTGGGGGTENERGGERRGPR